MCLDVPDASIDYIFVDPPFGENIFYSDLAFLGEAWHGVFSKQRARKPSSTGTSSVQSGLGTTANSWRGASASSTAS